jgi:hypothetical protein
VVLEYTGKLIEFFSFFALFVRKRLGKVKLDLEISTYAVVRTAVGINKVHLHISFFVIIVGVLLTQHEVFASFNEVKEMLSRTQILANAVLVSLINRF